MIITIDGPAGSGKSTTARALAGRLGFEVLDTGAMYRAVALAVLRSRAAESDVAGLEAVIAGCQLDVAPGRVLLNGEDVTGQIRTAEVTSAASRLAAVPEVRRFLVGLQRQIGRNRNMVSEGRDQGTVVFPDAARKFFLHADPAERARRRWLELRGRGVDVTLEAVLADQNARDQRDASRDASPMTPAADAVVIDTTHLTLPDVLERMEQEIRRCSPP
ncbi:MAG: (d)CMP kinase [Gemmataceae bacterium]